MGLMPAISNAFEGGETTGFNDGTLDPHAPVA
jgi:hypothetical protein